MLSRCLFCIEGLVRYVYIYMCVCAYGFANAYVRVNADVRCILYILFVLYYAM